MALRQVHHVDVVMHATATWLTMGNRMLGIPLGSSPMRSLGWAPTACGKQAMACTIPYRLYRILKSRKNNPLQRLAASHAARSAGP